MHARLSTMREMVAARNRMSKVVQCPVCPYTVDLEPETEDLEPCICDRCYETVHRDCMDGEFREMCKLCAGEARKDDEE